MTTELIHQETDKSLFAPKNFEHAFRIANMVAKSDMVPKSYKGKPQDVLIAMEYGRSINLAPLAAVQNIAVINGKPALYGDGMLGVCSGHKDFDNINELPMTTGGKVTGFSCTVSRKGRDPVTRKFTIEDAKLAGLWDRTDPWKKYPERMLQMRARAYALRDTFADALGGVQSAEEVRDYETKDITPSTSVKDDIKSFLQTVTSTPEQIEHEEKQPAGELANLDELAVIKDTIKDYNLSKKKVDETLKMFSVEHVEHLLSDQVDPFIAKLLEV